MRLYSGPLSLFSKKVEIALTEKALDCERILVRFTQTEGYSPKHPEVVRLNPKGQVPVFIDDDLHLYDSTLIIDYLEDAYPEPPLFPANAKDRARCRQMELFADEVVFASVAPLLHRTEPDARARGDWQAREERAHKAEAMLTAHYDLIDRALADKNWLMGAFSAADIALFLQVFYANRLGGPSLAPHGALLAWYKRAKARPSFAVMIEETLAADNQLSAKVEGAFKDAP